MLSQGEAADMSSVANMSPIATPRLSLLLMAGRSKSSLYWGAIPNCVYKNRELCWGIRGLVSAFSFAGHLLGVPVPCAELMTAFV